jgi:hypothetical protein
VELHHVALVDGDVLEVDLVGIVSLRRGSGLCPAAVQRGLLLRSFGGVDRFAESTALYLPDDESLDSERRVVLLPGFERRLQALAGEGVTGGGVEFHLPERHLAVA